MKINKITKDTKSFKNDFISFWLTETDYIIQVECIIETFPIDTPLEEINDFIFDRFDKEYYAEDNGDYWEVVENEIERDEEEICAESEEKGRIYELLIKLFNTQQKVQLTPNDAYELDIEYLEEDNHNLFNAAVVLKYCDITERYFPINDHYSTISEVIVGDVDVIYSLTDHIYNYFYNIP